jgi:PadR family transcriptional regulator PadR
MPDHYLGEFEEIVLLAICGTGEDAYAVPIQQFIEDRAQRATTLGSVYRALNRLEKKSYVTSWMGEVSRVRGGKRKRFYSVTSLGRTCVYEARLVRERMWGGLDSSPAFKLG